MKRITGNWLRNNDSKEIVATIWPRLEEFLEKKGFSFSTSRGMSVDPNSVIDSVNRYDNLYLPKEYELDEVCDRSKAEGVRETAKKDLLESRKKFIGGINQFNYHESVISQTLDGNPIINEVNISPVRFGYESSNHEIMFHIYPGAGVDSCYQNHGIFSNSKKQDKQREYLEKITDASTMIVGVNYCGNSLAKEVKKQYRDIRKEIIGKK